MGAVTRYVYDIQSIMQQFDGIGVLQSRYTQGDQIDQTLELEHGGQRYFYEANHLGSIRTVRNATGVAVNQYDYDAYGQSGIRVETVAQPYGFTGREFDAESGLYHYRARQLDTHTGRFVQTDPIGFAGKGLNTYAYVRNNPIRYRDPRGTELLDEVGVATAIAHK